MKITSSAYSTILLNTIALLLKFDAVCTGTIQEEFGNALYQDIKTVSPTDSDVKDVIQFVKQYARKRYPWSIPRSSSQGPEPLVEKLIKKILIYSHDAVSPLYYDDVVQDRLGYEHGMTRFINLGIVYNFALTWTESMIRYCHNFTISVYPKDHINIYTHTYFLQNLNSTSSNFNQSLYLFPKVGSSYFKYLANSEHVGEFTYMSEFPHMDTDEGSIQKPYADLTGSSSSESEGSGREQVSPWEKTKEHRKIKVMTYNIWNMNSKSMRVGSYTERMERLKETILQADPDIIGLQEVRYEEAKGEWLGPCQIHTLSEWLSQYQYVYQPAQMQPNTVYDGRTEEGVAIMSKYPIISHKSIMLFINRSNSADMHQRVLLQADIFIPAVGKVHIFNTHLSLSHEAREKSMVQIWNHAKQQKGPVIVLGDFNAEPHEPAVQYLSGNNVFPGEDRSQLIDVWSTLNPDQKGLTYNALDKNLTKRIDYIFFQPGEQCCNIESCNVLDDGSRGYKAASDHVPVMTILSMKTKAKQSKESS